MKINVCHPFCCCWVGFVVVVVVVVVVFWGGASLCVRDSCDCETDCEIICGASTTLAVKE